MSIAVDPIGTIYTPYKQKFAIPRQPGLVDSAEGEIQFSQAFNDPNFLRGIEQFSHLWLIFHFHQTADKGFSPLVRPPRLGGNQKMGVFATRSTFRPNSMGMSVVEFVALEQVKSKLILRVKGVDLLDCTPILDIKPYVPYADALPHAQGGYAQSQPELMPVEIADSAQQALQQAATARPNLPKLIEQVLSQDPRPAYKAEDNKRYGMSLYEYNIQWQVSNHCAQVVSIETQSNDHS